MTAPFLIGGDLPTGAATNARRFETDTETPRRLGTDIGTATGDASVPQVASQRCVYAGTRQCHLNLLKSNSAKLDFKTDISYWPCQSVSNVVNDTFMVLFWSFSQIRPGRTIYGQLFCRPVFT